MPGYSSPADPHQSNGGNYMVMPGGNSHPNMSSLKYGIQQFKPLPNAATTGFGSYTTPSGYAMNASGVVGGAIGIEDSSRLKYKDGNLYVPNPQAETSEMWMQNPRDLQGMQSAQYYNMTGQQTPHGAFLPSHSGHTQFSPPGNIIANGTFCCTNGVIWTICNSSGRCGGGGLSGLGGWWWYTTVGADLVSGAAFGDSNGD